MCRSVTPDDVSSAEAASESEDDFVDVPKRHKPASRPTRMQPRRAATGVGIVDDSDNGMDGKHKAFTGWHPVSDCKSFRDNFGQERMHTVSTRQIAQILPLWSR